jgi:hypothetical protein
MAGSSMTTGSTYEVTWLDQDHLTAINPDTPQGRNPRIRLIKNGKEDNGLGFDVLAFTEDSNGTNPVVLLDSCWYNLRFTRSGKRAYLGARREDIHDHDSYTPEDLLHHSPTPTPQDSKSEPEIDTLDVEICHSPAIGVTPQETSPQTPLATNTGPSNVQHSSLYPT